MKNSLIALAVTVSLTAGAVYAATTSYSDVSGSWAQADINSVVEKDFMTGFNDGNFHPDAWVTRAEFTTMAGRTLGLTSDKVDNVPSLQKVNNNHLNFSNVEDQSWISSYPSGVFRPSNPIRRAEALSALSGTLNKPLVSAAEATQILSKYSDANQVPANVRREVATAIQYNMFAVDPKYGASQIDPMRPATRAEVIENLIRKGYCVRQGKTLRPSVKGIRLIDSLRRSNIDRLASPQLTGELEQHLQEVERGTRTAEQFV